jgi:hypothetical protein
MIFFAHNRTPTAKQVIGLEPARDLCKVRKIPVLATYGVAKPERPDSLVSIPIAAQGVLSH